MTAYDQAREKIENWRKSLRANAFTSNVQLQTILSHNLGSDIGGLSDQLTHFGDLVSHTLPELVENNHQHLPALDNGSVHHDGSYRKLGDAIYGTGIMSLLNQPGSFLKAMAFFYLSCHLGEAGHNCPLACNAGMLRVLKKNKQLPGCDDFITKMLLPSYDSNFTAAQFVTEIQGGSDVAQNASQAIQQADGSWKISGEKWFCSNCHADGFLMTARYDHSKPGTRGLALFFVTRQLPDGRPNHFEIQALKDKLGTRTLATGEITFNDAIAHPIEPMEESFKTLMGDVLHISRLFNCVCVAGMAQRAVTLATEYTQHRNAFGKPLDQLAVIQQDLNALHERQRLLNAAVFELAALQDALDLGEEIDHVFLRLLVNLNKSHTAKVAIQQIRNSIDLLAGNGMVYTFSELPRLMCDALVCENWEGTHHILEAQVLNDLLTHEADRHLLTYLEESGFETTELRKEFSQLKKLSSDEQLCAMPNLVKVMGEAFSKHAASKIKDTSN